MQSFMYWRNKIFLNMGGLQGFKVYADALVNEFHQRNGQITTEFSTSAADLSDKLAILNGSAKPGHRWHVFYCSTCAEHHITHPYHCWYMQEDEWEG